MNFKQQLSALDNVRSYMTYPRFANVLRPLNITSKIELQNLWEIWQKGIFTVVRSEKFTQEILDVLVEYEKHCDIAFKPYRRSDSNDLWYKIYFKQGDTIECEECDLLSYDGAKGYSQIFEPKADGAKCEILAALPKVANIEKCKIEYDKSKEYANVYELDFYHCSDSFKHGDKVIVALKGCFKELLYTEKYGYLTAKGDENMDTEDVKFESDMLNTDDKHRQNSHAITLNSTYRYMGNLTTDMHLLKNPKTKKNDGD